MGNLKNIIKRIQKNPETIHIKCYRFLKKTVFSKLHSQKVNVKDVTLNTKSIFLEKVLENKDIIQKAESILKKEYNLLGKQYILTEINWHKDFNSGKVWEKKYFSKVEYDTDGDKKIPWELSKCHHFVTLGLAYRQTKDQKYFEEYKKQLLNWIQENPYEIGINWVTPMECSIRSINWIQAYQLFKEEEKWKIFAKKELEKEILKQVSEDGVDYEASLNYHRLVTEILLLSYILGERTKNSFSDIFKKRLENMHEFIMYYTSPTGKAPAFGDTDNGRVLHIWDEDTNDHRDLLSIASVLFKRADFKAKGKYHEKLQLLINKEEYNKIETKEEELQSKAFTDWYIMRDKDFFLMINCGDIGRKGFGGHGHNDQLSFVLSTKEKDYIIHPGTYSYTSDKKTRNLLRSTAYHNTLLVNKQEQNIIREETPFDMGNKTKALCFQWQTNRIQDIFIGKHFGYNPNSITREIEYNKIKKEILITDRLKEEADLELNLYFHPEIKIEKEGKKVFLDKKICIECEEEPIIEKTIYSQEYGHLSETKKITLTKKGSILHTKIYPLLKEQERTVEEETPKRSSKKIQEKQKSKEEEYY